MKDILSVANLRQMIQSPTEQSVNLNFLPLSKICKPKRNAMKKVVCSLTARNMKTLSTNCHCVSQQSNYLTRLRNLSVNSSSRPSSNKVCKNSQIVLQISSFFKIALFLLVCQNITASASPLLLRKLPRIASQIPLQSLSLQESKGKHPLGNEIRFSKINQKLLNVQTSKGFLEKILLRKSRSVTSTCIPAFQYLSSLTEHAYSVANKARKQRKRKRNTYRKMTNRPWDKKCKYTHEALKRLYCAVDKVPLMFGDSTHVVLTSLRSMIFLMQEEMNVLNVPFIGLSQCNIRYPRFSQNKVLNDLFALKIELSEMCPK